MFLTVLQNTPLPATVSLAGTLPLTGTLLSAASSVPGNFVGIFGFLLAGVPATAAPRVACGGTLGAAGFAKITLPPPPDCVAVGPCLLQAGASLTTAAQRPYVVAAAATLQAIPTVRVGALLQAAADWPGFAPTVSSGGGGPSQPPTTVALVGSLIAVGLDALDGTDATPTKIIAGVVAGSGMLSLAGARVVAAGVLMVQSSATLAGGTGRTAAGRMTVGHGRVLDRVTRVRFRRRMPNEPDRPRRDPHRTLLRTRQAA